MIITPTVCVLKAEEVKGTEEIGENSWTLISLAASAHGTLLKCLGRQCWLAACPQ